MKKTTFLTLLILPIFAFVVSSQKAQAVSGADWKPGRIIDDVVFQNKSSMSVAQIQQFLNAKNPSCDTNGATMIWDDAYGDSVTRAVYSSRRGIATPFICLKDYYENPDKSTATTYPVTHTYTNKFGQTITDTYRFTFNNSYRITSFSTTYVNGDPAQGIRTIKPSYQSMNGVVPAGAKSAAQLIYDAAQAQNINPQVLMVLLEKEQSLITDNWTWPTQLDAATGNNCPDTAPCNPAFRGFYTQLFNAGAQFNYYVTHFDEYNYAPGWNNILYHPNADCGRKSIFIENAFTAALYIYTPYTPNDAALADMYGSGDLVDPAWPNCSSFGNRNFWRMFNDWFGSSLAPSFDWQFINQDIFSNENMLQNYSGPFVVGNRAYARLRVKNTGNQTWLRDGAQPVRLGTSRPYDRASVLCDQTWLSCARPTSMKEVSVAPGETATFEFWIYGSQPGQYQEYFVPMVEGVTWMTDWGAHYSITVAAPSYAWSLRSLGIFTDQTKTTTSALQNLQPETRKYIALAIRNDGNRTWSSLDNPVTLGTSRPFDRQSPLYDATWLSPTRPTAMKEMSVAPGETATFEFWVKAPITGLSFTEYFSPLAEGFVWMPDLGFNFSGSVTPPSYNWHPTSLYAYSDDSKTVPINLYALSPGQRVFVGFTTRNDGNMLWEKASLNPTRLGSHRPYDRVSQFCDQLTWLTCARPSSMKEASVAPGETATFEFWVKAPSQPGTYVEYFNPLVEQRVWMPDVGLNFTLRVL